MSATRRRGTPSTSTAGSIKTTAASHTADMNDHYGDFLIGVFDAEPQRDAEKSSGSDGKSRSRIALDSAATTVLEVINSTESGSPASTSPQTTLRIRVSALRIEKTQDRACIQLHTIRTRSSGGDDLPRPREPRDGARHGKGRFAGLKRR